MQNHPFHTGIQNIQDVPKTRAENFKTVGGISRHQARPSSTIASPKKAGACNNKRSIKRKVSKGKKAKELEQSLAITTQKREV